MRIVAVLMAIFAGTTELGAKENVSVPWSEFKTLYRESIERDLKKEEAPEEKIPFVYSMDEARYTLERGDRHAEGPPAFSISGSGRHVRRFRGVDG